MKKRIFGRMIKKLKWLVIISVMLVALGTVGIGIASVYHMKYALKSLFNMEFNTGNDSWAYGDISSYNKIGERAVAIARSRLNWSYSQAKRTLEGSWDCSSMVARCYQEVGFDLKAIMGAQWCMTTVGWKDFATKNKQFIEEADLQPGDVIWYGRPSGNHMMMYAGNGQVIHAKGEKYGTVYEPLANTGYRSAKQVYFFRPYLNLLDESTDDSSDDAFFADSSGYGPDNGIVMQVPGGTVWTGWTVFESGRERFNLAGSDGGYAYGCYQFDIGYSLVDFLKFCVSYNQAHYGAFQQFIDMSSIESGYRKETDTKPSMINQPLYSNRASLINAWHAAYMNYPDEFAGLQSRTAYEAYYLPAQRGMLSNYGINIKEYSPALRGTIWSLAIRNGATVSKDNTKNGLRSATSTYSPGIDEREWLTKIYEAEARRHPSQRIRWGTEQLAACFAFMNGATHLGGLDGNYDGAFIGSLNTSAAAGGVSNAMMLNAIKNDVVLTESDYRILKIDRDTLLYLLQKAYDYETQYLLQRSITVYGLREYQIEHEDEEGRWYEDAEEYVIKQIIVSNEDTECMLRLDWQMLYMYSILASMGREDRGETEGIWDWEITIKDVDVAFDQIAMKYDYAFNVMTDEKSEYDFATCQSLPHKTEIYGDPDTTSGRYTWYYPNSLLRCASSGYSDLAYTYSGGEINGITETYQNERYEGIPVALTQYYNFDRFHTLAKYMPGGAEALSRYEAYNQRAVMGNPIIYSGNFEESMGEWNLVSE